MTIERDLARLMASSPAAQPRREHRDALRGELLARWRHESTTAAVPSWRRSPLVVRAALAFALVIIAVSCLPSKYPVVIGKRIVYVALAGAEELPSGRALRAEVRQLPLRGPARVWALRDMAATTTIYVDVLDDQADAAGIAARLEQDVPALRRARREIGPLDGRIAGRLMDRFGRLLGVRPAPREIERARAAYLTERARAAGEGD